MNAVILAAGEGTRFFKSGGNIFKQLCLYQGVPLIEVIVQQLQDSNHFENICVVLGQNHECNLAIKETLMKYKIKYFNNNLSRFDNNFFSFMEVLKSHEISLNAGILIVECDCIFDTSDINLVIESSSDDDIVWSNIGTKSENQIGGFLYSNIKSGHIYNILDVKILKSINNDYDKCFNYILKMFGLTYFSPIALKSYFKLAQNYKNIHNLYFHQVIIDNINNFNNISVTFGGNTNHFNTFKEYNNINNK